MSDTVVCARGHWVVSWTPQGCDGGHDHRLFQCRMRVGSRNCGWSRLVPALSGACKEKDR